MVMKRSYHESKQGSNISEYAEALLLCPLKKTCINLANQLNAKHDQVYKKFVKSTLTMQDTIHTLEETARKALGEKKYLILDDTQTNKIYAQNIEGLELGFDGSTSRVALGFKMVTALLTDTKNNIPVNALPYVGRDLLKSHYKTKTEIGMDIIRNVMDKFSIERLLADAHYATKVMVKFLYDLRMRFLMKLTRTRIVTIGTSTGQLQDLLRLRRNARMHCTAGMFDGMPCYFYVIKIKNGSTVYFISSDHINPNEILTLYKIRWNIEIFHRTAKQYLGYGDCQMITLEKQRQHVLFVMQAYAFASTQAMLMNFKCVEHYITAVRAAKHPSLYAPIHPTNQNFSRCA